jgi:hypothetical protein
MQEKILLRERQFPRFQTQTLKPAGKDGTSGKTDPGILDKVYYQQLGVHGGVIHEAAIVYLRADDGRVRLKVSPSDLDPNTSHLELLKYCITFHTLTWSQLK